jgi:microcystin-dependent protein
MSDPFIAEVKIFSGNFVPRYWAICDGQFLSINQNQALFSILGTTYGGNGVTTFALPNLRDRVPMHAGFGAGLTPRTQGEAGGEAAVTLQASQMPAHSHTLRGAAAASTGTPSAAVVPGAGPKVYRAATNLTPMGAGLTVAGSGQAHENRQPYLGLMFIIALYGIFPSRN